MFFRLYAHKSNKKEKPNGGFEILNFKPPFLFSKKEYARYAKVAAREPKAAETVLQYYSGYIKQRSACQEHVNDGIQGRPGVV